MLEVAEALKIVLEHASLLPARSMAISPGVLGLILAENVAADLDMPPFDKAMMDGFAARSTDFQSGVAELEIVEEITAGRLPRVEVRQGQTSRIMTGAAIPAGVDSVVMVERSEAIGANRVRLSEAKIRPGLHILERGREMKVGEVILQNGLLLSIQHLGLLAAVGRTEARIQARPSVAILATGDELVPAGVTPNPGQIRNSNGPMIEGQVTRAGGEPCMLGIAADREDDLRAKIAAGLESDVLVLSGGVSAGKLDLVPGVLQALGVQTRFHKIRMKPGKPLFFGVRPRGNGKPDGLVFGLPGNPVSSLVGFELFVRPAIRKMLGLDPGPRLLEAELTEAWDHRSDRPTYHPGHLRETAVGQAVQILPWFGSPDLRGVCSANAFLVLPEGERRYEARERVHVLGME